ncbi:MAG: hypothetical protein NMK33_00655 [Candidatus Cardinium sp.]|uniref:hypothetical protein n=1 Tax=Cardinium endosymbiont of Dermatophagoides farinae TaxID=2597823 RepID=UPI001182A8E1|nr:hypothetical protein [Cardinium endosymbiont of Dermatophagoides farinae]TSJ81035.1 hypothetical protein FPG78_03330 [Cardinium endosymbiont of Dermatophagoides farinae]UWW97063.1 MAG: hypothetical protein NMK33_00655 [Candidatus Cardinium sp.]
MKKVVITDLFGLIGLILIGCALRCLQRGPPAIIRPVDETKSIVRSDRKLIFKSTVANGSAIDPYACPVVLARYKNVNDCLFRCSFASTPGPGFALDLWERASNNQLGHQRLFNLFADIIPQKFRPGILYVEIFDLKGSDTLAYMSFDLDLEVFCLGISYNLLDIKADEADKADNNKKNSGCVLDYSLIVWVMIHEFGHYLTLNKEQQYMVMDLLGPFARKNSILKQIEHTPSYDKIRACNRLNDKEAAYQCKKELVQQNEFVTQYATASSIEDAAETFADFVLTDKPNEPGVNGVDEKILFFYQYPKMVEIREAIRTNFKNKPYPSQCVLQKVVRKLGA